MTKTFLRTVEIEDRAYEFWKEITAPPAEIKYTLYDGNVIVLGCALKFRLNMHNSDPNWVCSYSVLDDAMCDSMVLHLRRNLVVQDNAEKLKNLRLERRLAAFDAKVARDKARKK